MYEVHVVVLLPTHYNGNFPGQIGTLVLLDVRRHIYCRFPHYHLWLPSVSASIPDSALHAGPNISRTAMNWQVKPLPPRECTFKPQNFYVGAALNVITDIIILSIPVPMLWKLQIKLSKKIAIGLLICSGTFVIVAAIVRAVLTLGNTPSGININRWGVRETIVGILTVNLPILRPMFSRKFWSRGSFHEGTSSYGKSRPAKSSYGPGTFELRSVEESKRGCDASDVELVIAARSTSRSSRRGSSLEKESEEPGVSNGIVVVKQTYISHSPRDEEEASAWENQDKNEAKRGFHTNISGGRM